MIAEADILERLRDLHKQATTERSHFYVAKCCEDAIEEIATMRRLMRLSSGVSLQLIEEFLGKRKSGRDGERQ